MAGLVYYLDWIFIRVSLEKVTILKSLILKSLLNLDGMVVGDEGTDMKCTGSCDFAPELFLLLSTEIRYGNSIGL
jgi:hypothetical protein